MTLGLSQKQIAQRRKYVCAGDAARILEGKWNEVWLEKMGLAPEPDLADILAVQMGSYTEPFNLSWYMRQTGRPVEYYTDNALMAEIWGALTLGGATCSEMVASKRHPWMACNLDAMSTTSRGEPCVLDAKHVGRVDEQMVLRYTAAGVHQATVCEVDHWALSCLVGNSKWELIEQAVDPFYQARLVEQEREFWGYVEREEEPVDAVEAVAPPKPQPKLREIVVPTENDEVFEALCRKENWLKDACHDIATFASTKPAADLHAITREHLKALVPDDVGTLRRGLFRLTRTKAGSVTMTLKDDKE